MRPYRFIHSIVAVLNMLVALLLIVSSFSDTISPNKWLIFSYLGLAFPVFLTLNICFLLYWLLLRKWLYAFLVLCSLLVCWKPITQYVPFHMQKADLPKENVLKVLTYNVMCFGYQDHTPEKPNEIIQYIANSGADIVCMQEYMEGNVENVLTASKITRSLSMYPYHYDLPLVNYNRYTIGLAIYSKYPILNSWKVRYDSSYNGSTVHEIDVHGKRVMVVNNHLESFKFTMDDRSKYSEFVRNVNTDTFDGVRGAIQRKLGNAFQIRAEQADIVSDEIRKLQGDYIIVCGDFNDTPISYAHRTIQGPLKDAFVESGRGLGISYNENFFWFRIDNIMYSSNMKAYNATVDHVKLSDHYPMWCYLQLE